jgi:hypothetical protein
MNRAEKEHFLQKFNNGEACKDCGGLHTRECPRVKRKAFHPNGNLIEVEYWPGDQYDQSVIIFPDDLFEEDDE